MLKSLFSKKKDKVASDILVKTPLKGKLLSITEVPDDTFATRMLGDGVAIEPEEGIICSPVNGEVALVFLPSKHAVAINSDDGLEILIHIGLDTVKMNGDGFEALVKAGDRVTCGQELIRFDLNKVKINAASTITPVVITNVDTIKKIDVIASGQTIIGEDLIKVER